MSDDAVNVDEMMLFTHHAPVHTHVDEFAFNVSCTCGWVALNNEESEPRLLFYSSCSDREEGLTNYVTLHWRAFHAELLGEVYTVAKGDEDPIPAEIRNNPDLKVTADHAGFHFFSERPDKNNPTIFKGDNIPWEYRLSFYIGMWSTRIMSYDLRNGTMVDDLRKFLGEDYTHARWICQITDNTSLKPYETSGSWPLNSSMTARFVQR